MTKKECKATAQELRDAGIPIAWRDACADILIPLNKCRRETLHAPWKCVELRHAHEKCEYELYTERLKEKFKATHSH